MSKKTFLIVTLTLAVSLSLTLYFSKAQENLDVIQTHRDAEGSTDMCTLAPCHGSKTDETSLDPDIKPVHTLHLTNPLLNLDCTSCHKSDMVNNSAAHLRRGVDMSTCTTCHAEFFRKPLKALPERVALLTLEAGYSEFSLPYDYTGIVPNDAAQVLEIDSSKLRLATAVGAADAGDYTRYPESPANMFKVGRGYQISLEAPVTIFVAGEVITQSQTSVLLDAGWNMIGQPYMSKVRWDNVRIQTTTGQVLSLDQAERAGVIDKTLWGYERGSDTYKQATMLERYKAYWIEVNEDCTLLIPRP